jgi:hypothetical protein
MVQLTDVLGTRTRKLAVVAVVTVMILAGIGFLLPPREIVTANPPSFVLPPDYMVMMDEPQTEYEMAFTACLAPVINHGGYHPFFILQDGQLDAHSLWTVENSGLKGLPVLLFSNSTETEAKLKAQLPDVTRLNMTRSTLNDFAGFEGRITVRNFREALWVSGLAAAKNCSISLGGSTFHTQAQVWKELAKMGIPASYVVVANPRDYDSDLFDEWHIRALSAVAGELAAYHTAYVITDIAPSNETLVELQGAQATAAEANTIATGLLGMLRNMSREYGPIENIAIVGGHPAVPQFQLPDFSKSEGDQMVSSDSCYGFLDGNGTDDVTIDAAVGRIVNYNVQGAANQLVRTFCYDKITKTVDVEYSSGQVLTRDWTKHGSSFNGYEITHQRMQATPGYYWCRDAEDEGMSYEYYGPSGIGTGILTSEVAKENDFDPILQGSGIMAYRGHGSWHGSLYSLRVYTGYNQPGNVEGTHARELFLPPQVVLFAACENAKIYGMSFSGTPCDMDRMFATNYMYGGAIVLVGATEVSYSDLGQDFPATVGHFTGDHDWDKNNAMYAFFFDGIMDHEAEKNTVGKSYMWMINRYIKNHGGQLTPLKQADQTGDGADWKQVSMYVLYGDPAFAGYATNPGANQRDEWHNGAGDQ